MAVGNVGDEVYSTGLLFGGQSITGGSPAEDVVPEPSTLSVLGLALLALGLAAYGGKSAHI